MFSLQTECLRRFLNYLVMKGSCLNRIHHSANQHLFRTRGRAKVWGSVVLSRMNLIGLV